MTPLLAQEIAICIVSFERAKLTQRCIDSIYETTQYKFLIYLVDSNSKQSNTLEFLNKVSLKSEIILIKLDQNYGPAYARNVAVKKALQQTKAQLFAMFDNDMIALPGWDLAAINACKKGVQMIQPKLLTSDQKFIERGPNRPRKEVLSANPEFIGIGLPRDHPDVNSIQDVAIVGAGIYHREIFESVGLYDENLHIGEDFDLSFRARAAGFNLRYVPSCELIHDHIFEIEYDLVRARLDKYLVSHVVLWRKHKKALLSPAFLQWYWWLDEHDEPMYLKKEKSLKMLLRRLRRKLTREWIMVSYKNVWDSESEIDLKTEKLAQYLHIN